MTRCLCLNVTYEPLGFLSQNRAVTVVLEDKAEILEVEDGEFYNSAGGLRIEKPKVIHLKRYIKVPRSLRESISPRVLFARDGFTCQYCGKHQSEFRPNNRLTIDHIKPKAQGGPHHWENVVTCCYICNIKKRDRTPMQANMPLNYMYKNRSPKKPHLLQFTWGGKVCEKQEKWIVSYYGVASLHEPVEGLDSW